MTSNVSRDAFGNAISTSSTQVGPFGFAGAWGYQGDGRSGLQLLGHRYFDASTGRFLSRDHFYDGRNWYSYGNNNPTKYVDPCGEFIILIVVAVLAVVVLAGCSNSGTETPGDAAGTGVQTQAPAGSTEIMNGGSAKINGVGTVAPESYRRDATLRWRASRAMRKHAKMRMIGGPDMVLLYMKTE